MVNMPFAQKEEIDVHVLSYDFCHMDNDLLSGPDMMNIDGRERNWSADEPACRCRLHPPHSRIGAARAEGQLRGCRLGPGPEGAAGRHSSPA